MRPCRALSERSDTYRRRARRVGGACAGRPVGVDRGVRGLSAQYDRECRSETPVRYVPGMGARGFAEAVEGKMDGGGVLRYSKRLELMKIARGFGITRFEANLVIAAVQHERREDKGEVRSES